MLKEEVELGADEADPMAADLLPAIVTTINRASTVMANIRVPITHTALDTPQLIAMTFTLIPVLKRQDTILCIKRCKSAATIKMVILMLWLMLLSPQLKRSA